jgi:hypothetical protein
MGCDLLHSAMREAGLPTTIPPFHMHGLQCIGASPPSKVHEVQHKHASDSASHGHAIDIQTAIRRDSAFLLCDEHGSMAVA